MAAHDGSGGHSLLRATGGEVGNAVWVFRIQDGELTKLADDVAELWERRWHDTGDDEP